MWDGKKKKKKLEKARMQYLEKLFSRKQQKVSLLTDFKQMNPLSGKHCLCFESNLKVV